MKNHFHDLRAVLSTLKTHSLVSSLKKSQLFMREVEFCGHILCEGRRSPAPVNLLLNQEWEIPHTVIALQRFLGLENYFAQNTPGRLEIVSPDGKAESQLARR